MIHKIISYISSIVLGLVIWSVYIILHPIQVLALKLSGYKAHKWVVDLTTYLTMYFMILVGMRFKFSGRVNIPIGRPIIVISNHQSTFDIPPIIIAFRKYHPKFIAKKSLGKNIPSVSYNLRHGGSVLIDRDNQKQSIGEIIKIGNYIENNKYTVVIFAEGTRSTTGELQEFKVAGVKALLRKAPSAIVVPYAIDGNYKLHKYGLFPLAFGQKVRYTMLEPIEPNGLKPEEIVAKAEQQIRNALQSV